MIDAWHGNTDPLQSYGLWAKVFGIDELWAHAFLLKFIIIYLEVYLGRL